MCGSSRKTVSLSLAISLTQTHTHSLSLDLALSHTQTHTLSLSILLSLTHTLTLSHDLFQVLVQRFSSFYNRPSSKVTKNQTEGFLALTGTRPSASLASKTSVLSRTERERECENERDYESWWLLEGEVSEECENGRLTHRSDFGDVGSRSVL